MVALITMQMLFGFVVLPLIVILTTLISCGPPRPKHELTMTNKSQRRSKKTTSENNKLRNKKESKKSSKTQKTRSTRSRSEGSLSNSRKQRSSPLKQSRHVEPLASNAEKSSRASKKSNEEQRDLKMEPIELRWNTNGGVQKVFISNPTNIRRALKVKCSDNNLYRVNPVYSFIEPGQVLAIDIFRQNGGAKVDKMVFVAAMAKNDEQNPRAVFQDDLPKPMMVLPLIATSINA
ncbi:Sperm-specific class P protein [Dirofilaria immitis]